MFLLKEDWVVSLGRMVFPPDILLKSDPIRWMSVIDPSSNHGPGLSYEFIRGMFIIVHKDVSHLAFVALHISCSLTDRNLDENCSVDPFAHVVQAASAGGMLLGERSATSGISQAGIHLPSC